MTIGLPNPDAYTVPPSEGFIPDRLGVRRVLIDVDRTTGAYVTSLTPCPATRDRWGPVDAPEVSTPDLAAELMAAPDSADKMAALMAMQRVAGDLVTVAGFMLSLRN